MRLTDDNGRIINPEMVCDDYEYTEAAPPLGYGPVLLHKGGKWVEVDADTVKAGKAWKTIRS